RRSQPIAPTTVRQADGSSCTGPHKAGVPDHSLVDSDKSLPRNLVASLGSSEPKQKAPPSSASRHESISVVSSKQICHSERSRGILVWSRQGPNNLSPAL